MIELLIGLTITMIIMLGLGSAFKASAASLGTNNDLLETSRVARALMRNISDTVRRADRCDLDSGLAPGTCPALYFLPVDLAGSVGTACAYIYDPAGHELLLDRSPVAPPIDSSALAGIRSRLGSSVVSVARDIAGLGFTGEYAPRPSTTLGAPADRLVNVQITMQITVGQQTTQMCESVVPRRAYQQR